MTNEVLKKGNDLLSRECSNIGADGLNFSVRYGKRWNPVAIIALNFSINLDILKENLSSEVLKVYG